MLNINFLSNIVILLLGIYMREKKAYVQTKTCSQCLSSIFIAAPKWEQSRDPSAGKPTHKMWNNHRAGGRTVPKFSSRGLTQTWRPPRWVPHFMQIRNHCEVSVNENQVLSQALLHTFPWTIKPSLRPSTVLKFMLSSWMRTPEVHQPRAPAREKGAPPPPTHWWKSNPAISFALRTTCSPYLQRAKC